MKILIGKGIPDSSGQEFYISRIKVKSAVAEKKVSSSVNAESGLKNIEKKRFFEACEELSAQIEKIIEQQCENNEARAIFEAHRMILKDESYIKQVETAITDNGMSAEAAVENAGEYFEKMLYALSDELMRSRADDIRDITNELLNILGNAEIAGFPENSESSEPVIFFAKELLPSDVMRLTAGNTSAIVLMKGTAYSHVAILAKAKGIPLIIGAEPVTEKSLDITEKSLGITEKSPDITGKSSDITGKLQDLFMADGKLGIADVTNGRFYIEPDEKTYSDYMKKKSMSDKALDKMAGKTAGEALEKTAGKIMGTTADNPVCESGRPVMYANAGSLEEVFEAKAKGAAGIGLLRTEFLFMECSEYPSEEEQFECYKKAVECFAQTGPVIIRTMDLGSDKCPSYFKASEEKNPALGYRGIRVSLRDRDNFKKQLRAILRAACYGKAAVMYPMVVSPSELASASAVLEECREELRSEGAAFGDVSQGVMIETPAAVMMSRELAEHADFVSIGTNDLTQFMMAWDRENEAVGSYIEEYVTEYNREYNTEYNTECAAGNLPVSESVLRAIEMTVKNAHAAGARAGICGELAAEPHLAEYFAQIGVDELSVSRQ